jgi:ABC-type Fe3+-hydroxamate transport system substrate-binding protein
MLEQAGLINAIEAKRYPTYSLEAIAELNPDVIFLSSEPFPFKQQHLEKLKAEFPQTQLSIVDGELFSWYGSRLLQFPAYLSSLVNKFQAN